MSEKTKIDIPLSYTILYQKWQHERDEAIHWRERSVFLDEKCRKLMKRIEELENGQS